MFDYVCLLYIYVNGSLTDTDFDGQATSLKYLKILSYCHSAFTVSMAKPFLFPL